MDNDECGPTQLWELPDSECLNFHWVGYLAMELATGEIALSSKLLLFVLISPLSECPEVPCLCIGSYSLVIVFLVSGLVKLANDISKCIVCS